MKLRFILAAAASITAATPLLATTVDINASSEGSTIASGSFSYATGDTGVLGYNDLSAFSLDVAGVTYSLSQVEAFTDYVQFAYNTATNTLETNADTCGFAGCDFVSILSATNSDGTSGFFFNPPPGDYAEYSTGGAPNSYDKLTLTSDATSAVPEPMTWAMMIGGFGLIGGMMRYAYRSSGKGHMPAARSAAIA